MLGKVKLGFVLSDCIATVREGNCVSEEMCQELRRNKLSL